MMSLKNFLSSLETKPCINLPHVPYAPWRHRKLQIRLIGKRRRKSVNLCKLDGRPNASNNCLFKYKLMRLEKRDIIGGSYAVERKIGSGSFGQIYLGKFPYLPV